MGSGAGGLYGAGLDATAPDSNVNLALPESPVLGKVKQSVKDVAARAKMLLRDESGHANFSRRGGVWLPPSEYAMVMSALNDMYRARLQGKKKATVPIGDHTYGVIIHDRGNYTIVSRRRLD